jgi:hypothetical protein
MTKNISQKIKDMHIRDCMIDAAYEQRGIIRLAAFGYDSSKYQMLIDLTPAIAARLKQQLDYALEIAQQHIADPDLDLSEV